MTSNDKIRYNVIIQSDGLGWLWFDEDHSITTLYNVTTDDIKLYYTNNSDNGESSSNTKDREGTLRFIQNGNYGCCEETFVKVKQSGVIISYNYAITNAENISVFEETTLNDTYIVEGDSEDVQFIAKYTIGIKITKTVNGNPTSDVEEINLSLESSRYPQFFEWTCNSEDGVEQKYNGLFGVSGGDGCSVSASLTEEGVNYIKSKCGDDYPQKRSASGGIIYGEGCSLTVEPLTYCSNELVTHFSCNNVESSDYSISWENNIGGSGNGKAISPNSTTNDIKYNVSAVSSSDSSKKASTVVIQPGSGGDNERSYVFYCASGNEIVCPTTGCNGIIDLISYYNDECSSVVSATDVSCSVGCDWINVGDKSIDGTKYTFPYTAETLSDTDDRECDVTFTQSNSEKKVVVKFKQSGNGTVEYTLDTDSVIIEKDGCYSGNVSEATYTVIKTTTMTDGTVKIEEIERTATDINIEVHKNASTAATSYTDTYEDSDVGEITITVNQPKISESSYNISAVTYYEKKEATSTEWETINSLTNIDKNGGWYRIKFYPYSCNNDKTGAADGGVEQCNSSDGSGNAWLNDHSVTSIGDGFYYYEFHINHVGEGGDCPPYGSRNATVYIKFIEDAANGKLIPFNVIQYGDEWNGRCGTPLCSSSSHEGSESIKCVSVKQDVSTNVGTNAAHITAYTLVNSCSYDVSVNYTTYSFTGISTPTKANSPVTTTISANYSMSIGVGVVVTSGGLSGSVIAKNGISGVIINSQKKV